MVDVFRKGSMTRPLPQPDDASYDWEKTFCLNLVLQQSRYFLSMAQIFRGEVSVCVCRGEKGLGVCVCVVFVSCCVVLCCIMLCRMCGYFANFLEDD